MTTATTIGSHLSKTAATELAPLVEKIAKKADTNRDGKVSSGEFQEFLTGLMKAMDTEQAAARQAGATADALALPAGHPSTSAPNPVRTIRALAAAIAKEQ